MHVTVNRYLAGYPSAGATVHDASADGDALASTGPCTGADGRASVRSVPATTA